DVVFEGLLLRGQAHGASGGNGAQGLDRKRNGKVRRRGSGQAEEFDIISIWLYPPGHRTEGVVAFRARLIALIKSGAVGATKLASETGVSKVKIDKLWQGKARSTTVDDAVRLAKFFETTVEEMCTPQPAEMREFIRQRLDQIPNEQLAEMFEFVRKLDT